MGSKKYAAIIILSVLLVSIFVASRGPNFCNPSFTGSPESPGTGQSSADISLENSYFPSIEIVNSDVSSDLLDPSFWSMVGSGSAATFRGIIPQTIIGFIDSSQEWRDWILQHTIEPPAWVRTGSFLPVAQEEVAQLEAEAISSNSSAGAAMAVQDFAASIGGYTLAGLDYLTFGGLTALNTYFETGSVSQAVCASFPGQLGQLYQRAFDSTVPRDIRAQYLGEALAITTVIALVGGAGGFSDKFQGAIDGVGLGSVWETVKPYFSSLGELSPGAAEYTLDIIQRLASRFPQAPWVAGFTADRIDSMAEVLHGDGFSDSAIEQKIVGLVQAAGDSTGPDDVATDADDISYQDGGGLMMKVGTQNRLYLYTDQSTMIPIEASFLQDQVPGFKEGTATPIEVIYLQEGVTVYHYYSGGETWTGTVPNGVAKIGDTVKVRFQILTTDEFINSLPQVDFVNQEGVNWVANAVKLTDYKLVGDQLTLDFSQDPSADDGEDSGFSVTGQVSQSLGFNSASGMFLDVHLTDVFAADRTLRIYFDGYDPASLGLDVGKKFGPVYLISFDGVRLKIAYQRTGIIQVATLYPVDPSVLYTLSDMHDFAPPYKGVGGYSQSFMIDSVITDRNLEKTMAYQGVANDVARIGAEIAYTVATEKLGLKGVIMEDPSQGGADLYTQDGKVVIEARMLQRTVHESSEEMAADIQVQLIQMVGKVDSDFDLYPAAQNGYVILTYIDQTGIHTIVLEVVKP